MLTIQYLGVLFITGLISGGVTCMAVQGGLLASIVASGSKKEQGSINNIASTILFLVSKLFSYTILGFLLGLLGSKIQLSILFQSIVLFAVSLFMIGNGLNLLQVHPIFRYFVIQTPKRIFKFIRMQSKKSNYITPLMLGALTVCIPCGTTQAMMALAVSSADPVLGAIILFIFTLGTIPLFFLFGFFISTLTGKLGNIFIKITAILIILFALYTMYNALLILFEYNKEITLITTKNKVYNNKKVFESTIYIKPDGYSPENVILPKNSNIQLIVINKDTNTCAQSFTIPSLNIQKVISPGSREVFKFKTPNKDITVGFMCSMGMYRGNFLVK